MFALHEELARARMREDQQLAAARRRGAALAAARRWQRRAERAAVRARLALISLQ